jgi:hypothetical protein
MVYVHNKNNNKEVRFTRFCGQQLILLIEDDEVALYLDGDGENELDPMDMPPVVVDDVVRADIIS